MNPSSDQIKSAVRSLIGTIGGLLAGWAIGKGWVTQEQATAILSNQELMSAAEVILMVVAGSAVSAVSGIWGQVAHKQANMVATVAAMPDVAEVKTMPTAAGVALAQAVPLNPGAVVTVAKP